MTRIALSQRLTQEDAATMMVRFILIQLPEFFMALEKQRGDGYYYDVYYSVVRETLDNLPFETNTDDNSVLNAIATAMALPRAERASLLYRIMIEPFL